MAMLIAVTSMPTVQAHAAHLENHGTAAISLPALAGQIDGLDGALYLAEENETAAELKTPSERLGGDQPALAPAPSLTAAGFAAFCPSQPEQLARVGDGLFRSPHKTGPPRI